MADVDVNALLRQLAEKDVKIEKLEADNFRYRDERRETKAQIDKLEADLKAAREAAAEGKVPDGATVLDAKEAKAYDAYRALGTPEELTALKTGAAEKDARLSQYEQKERLERVAEVTGAHLPALRAVAAGLDYVEKEIEADGKKTPAFFVKDAEGQEVPFKDYVAANLAAVQDSLFKEEGPQKRPFPRQPSSGDPAGRRERTDAEIAQQQRSLVGMSL